MPANASHTAKRKKILPSTDPLPGQLWKVTGPVSNTHAIFLGGDLWMVLTYRFEEYTLIETVGLTPLELGSVQPREAHWADQFDALAAAEGLNITWEQEVQMYRSAGLALSGFAPSNV